MEQEIIDELYKAHSIIRQLWAMACENNVPETANWPYMREKERLVILDKFEKRNNPNAQNQTN